MQCTEIRRQESSKLNVGEMPPKRGHKHWLPKKDKERSSVTHDAIKKRLDSLRMIEIEAGGDPIELTAELLNHPPDEWFQMLVLFSGIVPKEWKHELGAVPRFEP